MSIGPTPGSRHGGESVTNLRRKALATFGLAVTERLWEVKSQRVV